MFVGISINLTKILSIASLAGRGGEALVVLLSVLVSASLMLIPGQRTTLGGVGVPAVGIFSWVTLAVLHGGRE